MTTSLLTPNSALEEKNKGRKIESGRSFVRSSVSLHHHRLKLSGPNPTWKTGAHDSSTFPLIHPTKTEAGSVSSKPTKRAEREKGTHEVNNEIARVPQVISNAAPTMLNEPQRNRSSVSRLYLKLLQHPTRF